MKFKTHQNCTHYFPIIRTFKTIFKKADIFCEPISFRLNKNKKFSTIFGGFFSITMIIILLILTQSKFSAFFHRSTVYVSRFDQITPVPPRINLNNRFAITVNPNSLNSLTGKRYFDFVVKISKYEFFSDGTMNYTAVEKNLLPCNKNNFPMITEEELNNTGVNNWVCPDFDKQDFFVEGTFSKKVYQYVSIYVAECTELKNKNGSYCASYEEIEKIKKSNAGKIYVKLKIINNFINLEDFENPFTPYIDELSFLINTKNLFVQKEVYLNEMTLITDKTISFNFLREDENAYFEKLLIYNKNVDTFSLNEDNYLNGQKLYTSIFLRSSQLNSVNKRKYDSFQDYLQALGALYSITFIFFKFVVIFFTKDILTEKIANALYHFPKKTKKNSENINKTKVKSSFLMFKNDLFSKLKEWISNKNSYGFKISEINKTIYYDMDLIKVLRKIKEIENIKKIFLNKDQEFIFEYISKPNFIKHNYLSKRVLESLPSQRKIYSKRRKIINSYKIMDNISNAYNRLNLDKNPVNSKILSLIDPDIRMKINKHRSNNDESSRSQPPETKSKLEFKKEIKFIE